MKGTKKVGLLRLLMLVLSLTTVLLANNCWAAGDLIGSWNPIPEHLQGTMTGYRIHFGTSSRNYYANPYEVGLPTPIDGRVSCRIPGESFVTGITYCFAVSAYSPSEVSGYSDEVCTMMTEGNQNLAFPTNLKFVLKGDGDEKNTQ